MDYMYLTIPLMLGFGLFIFPSYYEIFIVNIFVLSSLPTFELFLRE